eukprot:TRINITY_DN1128_c0_g12_i3.p1 TRINITY_DN1128_c0_g12~~TRINITY_DN1128_c0_g12_i3.p1  ORF type:complete len:493 (+),score=145.01 TRINITY_DN1128_c0_g12_i3:330-1808(+)
MKLFGKEGRKRPKHLKFRPYIDSMGTRPSKPPDRGYYYKLYKNSIPLIRFTLEDNGFREAVNANQEWSMMWSVSNMKSQVYQSMGKYQKVNHFPRSAEITRKDCLCKNVSKMQALYGHRHFDFVPKTFVLPQEMPLLLEEEEREPRQYWIVKPAASCQGRGIFVTNNILDIPEKAQMIASKYICDPLLINGLKFDIRIYVVLTSIDPLRLYVYDEGLARFATCKYSAPMVSNKKNKFIHLTNYAINKHNSNFVSNKNPFVEDFGSKWSLTALKEHLRAHTVDTDALWDKIDEILVKTILAIEPLIKSSCDMYVPFKDNCFELLGFDILLDSDLTPWLLEVNLSPSLNCDAPIDQKIKGGLIADLFTLIGIVPMSEREQANGKGGPFGVEAKRTRVVKLKDGAKDAMSRDERTAIRDAEEEYKRRGNFRRIFPTVAYNSYKGFFEAERPLNIALAHHLIKQNSEAVLSKRNAKILVPRKVPSRSKKVMSTAKG